MISTHCHCDISSSCFLSSHIRVAPSALLISLPWLLQQFHALLLAQIVPLPRLLTSQTPLDPLFQPQVAPSCLFFDSLLMIICSEKTKKHSRKRERALSFLASDTGRLHFTLSCHLLCSSFHMTTHLLITKFFACHIFLI